MRNYFIEETLSTSERVTIPFDTEEEMNNYITEKQKGDITYDTIRRKN